MTIRHQNRMDILLRLVITGLVVATCIRVWTGPTPVAAPASAQIPNAGAQRQKLLDSVHETNALLRQILHLLDQGTFKVQIASTDKPTDKQGVPVRGRPQ